MKRLYKFLVYALILGVASWLLTLGVFVDDDISNDFLISYSPPELPGCVFRIRVTSDEKEVAGIPFLFTYRRTVRRFGLIMMVQCESANLRELTVQDIVLRGDTQLPNLRMPIELRKSSGGRKYRSVFRGTLASQKLELTEGNCPVSLVCEASTKEGDVQEVTIHQEIPIVWQRRWSFGWTMLLYYSQF